MIEIVVLILYLFVGWVAGSSRALLDRNKQNKLFYVLIMAVSLMLVAFGIRTAGQLSDKYNVSFAFEVFCGVLTCILAFYIYIKKRNN